MTRPGPRQPADGPDAAIGHASAPPRSAASLLISHRLNAFRDADLILVLDGGTLVEQGTHRELVGLGGRYAELFRLQSTGYELPPDAHEPATRQSA